MLEKTYEYIWRNAIEPNIKSISNKAKKLSAKSTLRTDDLEILKERIFEAYKDKRDRLKLLYHFDDGTQERKIDCHKIAACFASVIYENPVFVYDISMDVTDDEYLANARLAYYVSIGIVFINLVYQYKANHKEEIVDKLLQQKRLMVPPTNPGHDSYDIGREKTLALNATFDNDFDILTYSDMMFWIEYYNRQLLEQTISPQPFEINFDLLDR